MTCKYPIKFLIIIILLLIITDANHLLTKHRPILNDRVAYILVQKKKHELILYNDNNQAIKHYSAALGSSLFKKEREGDRKTPEGNYFIVGKNKHSKFNKSIYISYPNENDRKIAKANHVPPGGSIMIHGIGSFGWIGGLHRLADWTSGCIAVTNEEIDEIYAGVPIGTPITIEP